MITDTIDKRDAYLPVRTVLHVIEHEDGVFKAEKDGVEFVVPETRCVEINKMEADIIEKQEKAKSRGIYHYKNYKEFYKKAFGIDIEKSSLPYYEIMPKQKETKKPEREDEGDSNENEIWV